MVSRSPWIAGTLSVIAPGVGHLYAGAPKRGAGAWLASHVVMLLAAAALVLAPGRVGLATYVAVSLAVVILVALDAARVARQRVGAPPWRWYERPAALLVACAGVWVASLAWTMFVESNIVDRLRIPTDTMSPTLLKGDRLFVGPRPHPIRNGDVVVYRRWETRYIKRVAGVPGDTVAMRAGLLSVDGRPMPEPYASHSDEGDVRDPRFAWQRAYAVTSDSAAYSPTLRTWGPLVVPQRAYFLLGDNRGETIDSRYNGFVADSDVIGRPLTIYFSRDRNTGRIRWDRIGLAVKGGT